ncbi:MAG TPA: rhamnulokinase family protein [Candidatus Dormibacteraeota bacterium]|nr:rhamnulokinase family protein [Candidatus Dormibacteraeota bacterium]
MPKRIQRKPYLAFDLGAESGRAVLAHLQSGILTTEQIHRFPNEPVEYGGSLHWDVARLWFEVRKALARTDEVELAGIGVDAWGVDYALVGESGELIGNPYHYRDRRTEGVMEEVLGKVGKQDIYSATGIQFMPINTLYQLSAARRDTPKLLAAAKHLLTIPDLFNYWLSGKAACEFTNATTTQMVDPVKRTWAGGLLQRLELPARLPAPIVEPGTILGTLLPSIAGQTSLADTPVIAPACHDTGSAVAAISAREGTAFLSSGTWSLLGTELDSPVITPDALRMNFTNEGGVNGTTRLLKNVMGLWMLQGCRRSWMAQGHNYDYRALIELAAREASFRHFVDPDAESFLRPDDMLTAVDKFCTRTHQPVPQGPGAYVRAVLESLAFKYRLVLRNLEHVSGKRIDLIRIIGGGSKNRLLNQWTADATGRKVVAGPAEATALGNVAIQILATGAASSLAEVRAIVERSFPTVAFEPNATDRWDRHAERFEQYCGSVYA